jgi:outer membrane protein TolC
MGEMRIRVAVVVFLVASSLPASGWAGAAVYDIDQAVALAQEKNPEIAIARKKLEAARGGLVEARSGYLPAFVTTGLPRER